MQDANNGAGFLKQCDKCIDRPNSVPFWTVLNEETARKLGKDNKSVAVVTRVLVDLL